MIEKGLDAGFGRFVVESAERQGRRLDQMQAVDDGPVPHCADDVEFIGSVHGVINRRILLDCRKCSGDLPRGWKDTADVAVVERLGCRNIIRVIGGPGCLVPVKRVLHIGRQPGA